MNKQSSILLALTAAYGLALGLAAWGGGDKPLPLDLYLLGLAAAFGCYFLLLWWIGKPAETKLDTRLARTILVVAVLCRVMMLAAPHRFNSDVWRYVWDGHVVQAGYNPYQFAPADRELDAIRDEALFNNLNPDFNHIHSVYGPVAMLGFTLSQAVPGSPAENIRILMVLGDLATIFVLGLTLQHLGRSELGLLAYACNPLLIDAFAQRGQMEGLLLPLIALSFYALIRGREGMAGTFLALAIGVKINMLLVVPIWIAVLARQNNRQLSPFLCGGLVTGGILAIPFWLAGPASLTGFAEYASLWQTNHSLFSLFKIAFDESARAIVAVIVLLVTAGLSVRLLASSSSHPPASEIAWGTSASLLVLLLLAPAVFPWYITWILPVLPLLPNDEHHVWYRRAILVWSGTVLLWYFRFFAYPPTTEAFFPVITKWSQSAVTQQMEPWRLPEYAVVFFFLSLSIVQRLSRTPRST